MSQCIDESVEGVCEYCVLEDHTTIQLDETMKGRQSIFAEDMEKLCEDLEMRRNPPSLSRTRVKQLQVDTFAGRKKVAERTSKQNSGFGKTK